MAFDRVDRPVPRAFAAMARRFLSNLFRIDRRDAVVHAVGSEDLAQRGHQ